MIQDQLIYKNILENMTDGVMTIGRDGLILTINKAAEKILGVRAEEVVDRTFAEIFLVMEGNDEFNQTILNAVYESSMTHNSVVRFNTAERERTLTVATSFLAMDNPAVIVVFNDITELERLRQTEEQLSEELKQKHRELQNSFISLEGSNASLKAALKRVQTIRMAATIFIIVVFLGVGLATWKMASPGVDAAAPQEAGPIDPAQVKTMTVTAQPLSDIVSLKGALKPIDIVNITSPLVGKVSEVFFGYGDSVRKGQVLLRIDASETEMKYRDAKSAAIKAEEKYRQTLNWETGDEVAKAKRSLTRAKQTMDTQKKTLQETEALFKKGIVAETEYTNAKQQYANAVMDYESAQAELKATLDKGKGDNLLVAKLERDNAIVKMKELESQLAHAEIRAPVSGTILIPDTKDEDKGKAIEKGVTFNQGEILLSIGNMEGLSVDSEVDEIEVLKIKQGMKSSITCEALAGSVLQGQVTHVSSQAVKKEGGREAPSFKVTVAVDDIPPELGGRIRLGMTGAVGIEIYNKPNALLIPIAAVRMEGAKRYVLIRDKATGQIRKAHVETGITTSSSVEILKGLSAGDEIVLP